MRTEYALRAAVLAVPLLLAAAGTLGAETPFPQEITAPEAKIVVYQPQPEKLAGNVLTGRAAMSILPKGKSEPLFGAFWFSSMIDTDREEGTVTLRDIKITRVRWPESKEEHEARFTEVVEKAAAGATITFSEERLSASLANAEREQRSLLELKNDPPKVRFATELSVLLLYDGPPRFGDVEKIPYERALNTPYLVVRDEKTKACYFGNGTLWYSATDPLGPWQPNTKPPADLLQALPKPEEDAPASPTRPPAVVTATEPTELIDSDGEPKWKPVGDGALVFVENTETPWLREVATNQVYVLLSGRWFRAASASGPWTFVRADQLPAAFKSIPAASDIGGVRVSVAGTAEAEDAMLDSAIPQTAAIKRGEAKLEVHYEGEPKFEKIPGTSVSLAQNTPTQVLEIGGKYYAVDNGVWFVSASAKGPWAVADSVPEDEIKKIPPSSSAYNTTYVHVYQSTPQVVYVGYTPGYMWSFPYYGVPVYGTGWYYPPYAGFYYPRPYTFGFHVGYNPWTGWGFGMSWNVGFMHFGIGWGGGWGGYYRPWGCCGGWYGGYRGWGYHSHTSINVNNRVSIGNSVNFGSRDRVARNIRSNPRASGVRRDNLYNRPESRARNADRATVRGQAQQARAARGGGANNVLADRDGNVLRHTPQGLQDRAAGKWQDVDREAARQKAQSVDRSSVQRDHQARERGASRERMRAQVPRSRPMRGGGRRR